MNLRLVLALSAALLSPSGLAQAPVIPSLPPAPGSEPTPPAPADPAPADPAPVAPNPVLPPTEPGPVPTEPVPTEPVPVEPAPPEPAPAPPEPAPPRPVPAPVPPRPGIRVQAPVSQAPLLITVDATWPALAGGRKTTVPFSRTLTIPGPRAALLRQRGVITESLEADLRAFLAALPQTPQDAHFEELWDGWAVVQRNGLRIDEALTRSNLLTALRDPLGVRAAVAVSGQTAPARTLGYFSSRGITAHLNSGETNYYGSSPARVTNIHVGASHFSDLLLEGSVVSFNKIVGPVSLGTGFVTGLVIAGERTANGVGGGICQVSTTVFRALYGAGLPILQRQNHSYQVHYYDPQGLDATIYQPALDLRFRNDTGGSLWFQTEWDDQEARLSVHVFGRPRDFTVELGRPRTLRSTPAPADRLLPDPGLSAGQRRQVDWAAPGAVIQVTRTFRRGAQVLRQDVLTSTYRPWPNIYLVGTRR